MKLSDLQMHNCFLAKNKGGHSIYKNQATCISEAVLWHVEIS